ncbi:DNA repair exonuclease SbcCD ATPase subunit [Bradyrhizobium diazoefficiens]
MAIHRKRFRVEEAIVGEMPSPEMIEEAAPMHSEIMAELRAIRAQMAKGTAAPLSASAAMAAIDASTAHELAETRTMLDTYRAQIEQCEKLKVELDLIHDAIDRTKREIATLHGKSFDGGEMAKVNGELGAVVGGTEQATQQILEAAESIDQAASAMSKVQSADQQKRLADDIQERVISIFEACNFQDLTGQRISKVMTTMKFIEQHINAMMEIWARRRRDQGPCAGAGRHPQRGRKTPQRSEARRRRRPCLAGRHRRAVRLNGREITEKQNAGASRRFLFFGDLSHAVIPGRSAGPNPESRDSQVRNCAP